MLTPCHLRGLLYSFSSQHSPQFVILNLFVTLSVEDLSPPLDFLAPGRQGLTIFSPSPALCLPHGRCVE